MSENSIDWLFAHPRLYDNLFEKYTTDIPFYLALADKYGDPILDLMCGTGRVTIPLARKGFSVTGLDMSTEMLEIARRKAAEAGIEIDWVNADGRDFFLKRKYQLILIAFTSLLQLTERREMETCLTSIKANMEYDGRFVIDIFNPDFTILLRNPEDRFPVGEAEDPGGRGKVIITECTTYNAADQILTVRWFYRYDDDGEEMTHDFRLRILYPQEIDALLRYFGFIIEDKFGDYDFSPFTSTSPKQLIVCRPR